MKNSIQSKLFSLCILLVIVTSISISIPFYLFSKQEKQSASQIRIHVAFEIIRDDILNRIKDYSVQIEEFVEQVSAISWGLRWYSEIDDKKNFFFSSTYSSYIITIGEEFGRFSHLVSADRLYLYGIDKRLLVSYHQQADQERLGAYVVTQDGQNRYLSIDDYSQYLIQQKTLPKTSLPQGLLTQYDRDIPTITTSEHFQENNKLGLRIVAPIYHKKRYVGLLIVETFYTQNMAERYSELSKTQVNMFAGELLSIGTLPAQGRLNAKEDDQQIVHEELLQLGKSTHVSSMTFEERNHYQGKYSLMNRGGIPVGAITASLSKEIENREIKKMLTAVTFITFFAIVISFVLTVIFSRKTILFIQNLTETTSAIVDGNLDEPIDTSGKDELGVLARSFSKMRQAIKEQLAELNSEVIERRQAEATIRKREKEKETLERQLNQSQKMEAIGTLAGGIAHDFNNILGVILGYSDLLKGKLSDDAYASNGLEQISRAGNRAKNLVSQILAFSRKSTKEFAPLQPDLIINEALELLRATIPTTINISHKVQNCGSIVADPTQLHQLVMNLCTNAYHAMRETGGEIAVILEPISLAEGDVKALSMQLSPGPYLKLEVSDTGHGMDKATLLKIFDPYFTTKKQGDGTGLGLAVVHGVVKSFGGHISVYSEPGEGTTFCIYLPEVNVKSTTIPYQSLQPIPTGTEHILLVDDEKSVLQMEKEMLEELGYQITACASSPEALKIFQKWSEDFSLMITDMTMPDMNGVELIQKIRITKPNLPIILCSGFSELINEEKAKRMNISKFLMKPVLQRDLATAVRKALDKEEIIS